MRRNGLLVLINVLFIILYSPLAPAHNVVSGVYADGMVIEGEIGYSNGDMAEAGTPVKVFDEQGKLVTELGLTEGGAFMYEAKTASKHVFKANLSAGHVAEMVVEADELHRPIGQGKTIVAKPSESKTVPETQTVPNSDSVTVEMSEVVGLERKVTVQQLESIVRSAVAQQIRPLQKELKSYKEKVMLRDIAGGLGFIFGLFGVAAWMASRRKQGDDNAAVS